MGRGAGEGSNGQAALRQDIEIRSAREGEPFYNYLGFKEVDDDEDVQIDNAFIGEELVGSVKFDVGKTDGTVYVQHIYVKPEYRGQGIARTLMESVRHEAKWNGKAIGGDWTDPEVGEALTRPSA